MTILQKNIIFGNWSVSLIAAGEAVCEAWCGRRAVSTALENSLNCPATNEEQIKAGHTELFQLAGACRLFG